MANDEAVVRASKGIRRGWFSKDVIGTIHGQEVRAADQSKRFRRLDWVGHDNNIYDKVIRSPKPTSSKAPSSTKWLLPLILRLGHPTILTTSQ